MQAAGGTLLAAIVIALVSSVLQNSRTLSRFESQINSGQVEILNLMGDIVANNSQNAANTAAINQALQQINANRENVLRLIEETKEELVDRFDVSQGLMLLALRSLIADDRISAEAYLKSLTTRFPQIAATQTGSPQSIILFSRGTPGIDFLYFLNHRSGKGDFKFASVRDPQWHPRKPRLLFSGAIQGEENRRLDLFAYDFVLQTLTRLTDNEANDFHAKWSPEGDHIVFVRRPENGQAAVFLRRVSEDEVTSTSVNHRPNEEVRHVAGAETGTFYDCYFPNYSFFDGWIMVTAETQEGEYGLWMVNLEDPTKRHPLFPNRNTFQCKGNWFDAGAFLVFNETPSPDPKAFESAIIRAEFVYDEEENANPFKLVQAITVADDGAANMAAEFEGRADRIVFARQASHGTQTVLKQAIKQETAPSEWEISDLRVSTRYSYEFPDWRSDYQLDVLLEYASRRRHD